ncbi:MAG: NepR family anti-sigma factor [Reyranella sp.]|nr:NepR family anti-sigma factor [Reyranella sp.]MDO8973637.1 NepR family anti-sigma factor [Reyranella sp.]MDP3238892.1 NepR family anti-sigma factor [Reyranella sp.]
MWLHKQLHAMYDEIASEPLPDDLLNLIDKDAAANKKGDSPEDPPKK